MRDQNITSGDVRIFLQSELVRRCKTNPKYSLRAFAKLLDVESSALSKILNGKRAISRTMLKKIGQKLALSPTDFQTFESSLVERRGRQKSDSSQPVATPTYQQMAIDHFHVASEWYHFAILELIAIEDFEPNAAWIAKSLGITLAETQLSIERLTRLGFLEIDKAGRWYDRAGDITNIRDGFTSAAVRRVQEQILSKAIAALEEVPIDSRDNSGMTMAIDHALLPEAKKKIAAFRRELCSFLQSGKRKDAVYQAAFALFPLTPVLKKKKGNK